MLMEAFLFNVIIMVLLFWSLSCFDFIYFFKLKYILDILLMVLIFCISCYIKSVHMMKIIIKINFKDWVENIYIRKNL